MNEKTLEQLVNSLSLLANSGNAEAVDRVLALIEANTKLVNEQQPNSGKYLYARVLTLKDGTKHYHPLVGGMYPSSNPEDYTMEAYDSILELQESNIAEIARMASRMGYEMRIMYVPNDVYDDLERELADLISLVFDAVDDAVVNLSAAAEILGNPMTEGLLKSKALEMLMSSPSVSGVGLTASNDIVERADYVDLEVERIDDEDYDDYDDEYDDCCGDCDCCDWCDEDGECLL